MGRIEALEGYKLTVDLEKLALKGSDGWEKSFSLDPFLREKLLKGLDDIGLTLATSLADIEAYEKSHSEPWQAALPPKQENAKV
jgi:3-isopropylmalate/(R)-2-methylmalate dehydratase small subunit